MITIYSLTTLLLAAAAANAIPRMGLSDSIVYNKNSATDTDRRCRCLAKTPQVPVHEKVCGPQTGFLAQGRLFRSLSSVPVRACNRRWWPLLLRDDDSPTDAIIVAWSPAEEPGGIYCDCSLRSSNVSLVHVQRAEDAPSTKLIGCICLVESRCNPKIGCLKDVGSLSCGPFQIKEPYWNDASRISHQQVGPDWKTCTTGPNNMDCSINALNFYVRHYGPLCATPATDEVYARVHNGGPKGCQKSSTEGYWNKVKACMKSSGRLDVL